MRRDAVIAGLALALAVTGCLGLLGGGGDVDPSAVGERVDDRAGGIDTLELTLNQTIEWRGQPRTVEFRVFYEQPGRTNFTVLDGSLPWDYAVSNASGTWYYDRSDRTVSRTRKRTITDPRDLFYGGARIGENATFEGNETLAGDDAVELSYALQGEEVSLFLAGGQPTSKLGRSQGNGSVRTRVWVGTDEWLPRKVDIELSALKPTMTIDARYDDITVDGEVPDGAFSLNAPADATVRRADRSHFRPADGSATFVGSRPKLVAAASVPVPDPSVPEDYSFEYGAVIDGSFEGVELTYSDGSRLIEVVAAGSNRSFFSSGERTTVDGAAGTYVDLPYGQFVSWSCANGTRAVGTGADRTAMRSVAASVGCQR